MILTQDFSKINITLLNYKPSTLYPPYGVVVRIPVITIAVSTAEIQLQMGRHVTRPKPCVINWVNNIFRVLKVAF